MRLNSALKERILVCVGPSPSAVKILHGARRMAVGFRAQWVAAYVDAPDGYPITKEDRERLLAHLRLAESLGAEVVRLVGHRVSDELLRYAREHNVTRIVLGKPTHPRWRDLFKGSFVDRLVRASGDIEVNFIAGDELPAPSDKKPATKIGNFNRVGALVAVALVSAACVLGVFARPFIAHADMVTVFLLIIMLVAFRYGRTPSLIAAALSVAAYDFSFVLPYYTFAFESGRHLLTFLMMFGVGVVISSLTSRLRGQERGARVREAKTAALYSLSRKLAVAQSETQIAELTSTHAAELFRGDAFVLLQTGDQNIAVAATSKQGLQLTEEEFSVARWAIEHGRSAGKGTDTLPGSRVTCVPIQTGMATLGAMAVVTPFLELLDVEHRAFLEAFVRQTALAIDRARLTESAKASALRIHTEETRSALLSAVSHDLRTPLGAIVGAGTALRDEQDKLGPEQSRELCDTICTEAERMERLVGNILDMVRLESGAIVPKREWVPLEETVGSALSRLESKLGSRTVQVKLPPDLPLLSVDPVLFEQVFINLIENVVKHCDQDTPIDITAQVREKAIQIEVGDQGPGLPFGAQQLVFDKFYRGPNVRGGGVGLGLSICRGIVYAHGGTITGENRSTGGSLFRITLPILGSPPVVGPIREMLMPNEERLP